MAQSQSPNGQYRFAWLCSHGAATIRHIRDQKSKAEVQKLRADTRGVMITNGEITAAQGLQLAVDAEDVPPEFLQQADMTPGGTLQDDEKPLEDEGPQVEPVVMKAIGNVKRLMIQELERARKLYQEVEE